MKKRNVGVFFFLSFFVYFVCFCLSVLQSKAGASEAAEKRRLNTAPADRKGQRRHVAPASKSLRQQSPPRHNLMAWHFRGSPHYVVAQARRLGLSVALLTKDKPNKEINDIGSVLAQLCDRYHRTPLQPCLPGEQPISRFGAPELMQIRAALDQAEIQVDKLHAVAAASQAMLTEAYPALGLEPRSRSFAVISEYDEIISSIHEPDHDERPVGAQLQTACRLP